MEHLNRIEIQGALGRIGITTVCDELHANFAVATNYIYKDMDGNAVIETTWHRVNAFESEKVSAETLNEMKEKMDKHDFIYVRVVGRLRQKRYTDSYGNDCNTYEIIASEVEIIK